MSIQWIAAAAIAASAIAASVSAEEQTLRFRVVLTKVSTESLEVANQPGRNMSLERVVGVAVFEDGRIANRMGERRAQRDAAAEPKNRRPLRIGVE